MKKSLFNPIFKFASSVTFIVSSVLLCMNPISCKMSEETIDVAEVLAGKTVRRQIVRDNKLYILARIMPNV